MRKRKILNKSFEILLYFFLFGFGIVIEKLRKFGNEISGNTPGGWWSEYHTINLSSYVGNMSAITIIEFAFFVIVAIALIVIAILKTKLPQEDTDTKLDTIILFQKIIARKLGMPDTEIEEATHEIKTTKK